MFPYKYLFILFYLLNVANFTDMDDEYYEDYDIDSSEEIDHLKTSTISPHVSYHNFQSEIQVLSAQFLNKFEILTDIQFKNNKISSIDPYTFNRCHSLQKLEISSNNLSNFDIEPILTLTELNLSNNSLTHLNSSNFQKLKLTNLDVSFNNISTISCNNVTAIINLSHNKLSNICTFAISIQKIDLSFNNISFIPNNTFQGFYNLDSLHLGNNQIATIQYSTFSDIKYLKFLTLSHNRITEIDLGQFSDLEYLFFLDLSYNNISIVHKISINKSYGKRIHPFKHLGGLHLVGNEITKFNVTNIIEVCGRELNIISISFAEISCSSLLNYISEFGRRKISVVKGRVINEENVNGIKCDSSLNSYADSDNVDKMLIVLHKVNAILIVVATFLLIFVVISILIMFYRLRTKKTSPKP